MKKVLRSKNNRSGGFVLVYMMVIFASVVVALAISASQTGIFSANRIKSYAAAADARAFAMYCAEILLMQVRNSPAALSSGTLASGTGSCQYSITGSVPNKVINLTAIKNNIYRRITISTTQIYPVIQAQWLEN